MTDIRVLVVDDDFRVAGLHRDAVAARPGFLALEPARTVGETRAGSCLLYTSPSPRD